MKHGSLFSGIGGFELAAECMGWENVFHCEWNEFGKRVLNYYWPKSESFHDITKTDFRKYANKIDILTGGFPCQPYSVAGKRKGKEDERHLWPEMLRAIREIKPAYVVGENVRGLINWNDGLVFEEVQSDLEALSYEVQPFILPAAGVNAPHKRERVWFIAHTISNGYNRNERTKGNNLAGKQPTNIQQARNERTGETLGFSHEQPTTYSDCNGCERCNSKHEKHSNKRRFNALNDVEQIVTTNSESAREQRKCKCKQGEIQLNGRNSKTLPTGFENFPTQPPICSRNDGFSERLDGITFPKWRAESVKAYGNAIVPQVAYQIFKAIEKIDKSF